MDLESVRKYLEGDSKDETTTTDSIPNRFHEPFMMHDLRIDFIEPGRIICSMVVPPRLVNAGNCLHGAATATLVDLVGWAAMHTMGAPLSGVSVEINVSYMDAAHAGEEIEIEAKTLHVGKAVAAVNVELRKKKTGKIIAQGRHTKFQLPASSKM